jgi:hypothetical protein
LRDNHWSLRQNSRILRKNAQILPQEWFGLGPSVVRVSRAVMMSVVAAFFTVVRIVG